MLLTFRRKGEVRRPRFGSGHDPAPAAKIASSSDARRECIEASVSDVIPFTPRAPAIPTISAQNSAGILCRERQLLTTGGSIASALAKADVPPRASISESGLMDQQIFTSCEHVNFHTKGIARDILATHAASMAKRYQAIGKRLKALRDALGITQAELCRQIKCAPNRWNQYEKGERQITVAVAVKLADEYGTTLDWVYRDERGTLKQDLYSKLYRAA